MKLCLAVVLCCALLGSVAADMYFMTPCGSNNRLDEAQQNTDNDNRCFDSQTNNKGGHHCHSGGDMYYYEGAEVTLEWQVQHASGTSGNMLLNMDMIIQYMCDAQSSGIRTGECGGGNNARQTPDEDVDDPQRCLHEPRTFYADCKDRERNKGLFTADQTLAGNTARFTRQNPAGTRYGLECPEEKDYYPYWHPTPWVDIAFLSTNQSKCEEVIDNSINVKAKHTCVGAVEHNNAEDCSNGGGQWVASGRHGFKAPICAPPPTSMVNSNGNSGDTGFWAGYNITFSDDMTNQNCIMRIRYNMTPTDMDFDLDASNNGEYENNPDLDIQLTNGYTLALQLNTAQTARTFQDRSHGFFVKPRDDAVSGCRAIRTLQCGGRRGNNDQTYPACEIVLTPTQIDSELGECLHIACRGTDFDDPNAAGEGTAGHTRHNICQLRKNSYATNYPELLDDVSFPSPSDNGNNFGPLAESLCTLGATDGTVDNGRSTWHEVVKQNSRNKAHAMSSRNNNYTNRGEKVALRSGFGLSPVWIALIVLGSLFVLGALAFGGSFMYAKNNPDSQVAAWFHKHNMARPSSVGSRGAKYRSK